MIQITGVDISRFNAAASRMVEVLNLNARDVVQKESGELMKTLVRITPPTYLAKSREALKTRIRRSFDAAATIGDKADGGSMWYNATSKFLFGVAPERDLRKADLNTIRTVYLSLSRSSGAQHIPFKKPRKEQMVRLAQSLVISTQKKQALLALLQKSFGRLKAGWLGAWDRLQPQGQNMPPAYVMRHKSGCRGSYIDGLGVKSHPTFTISNFAVGIGDPKIAPIIRNALRIRAKAMEENFRLMRSGKKFIGDYV